MMQTECTGQNMDGYIFGLTCLSESGPQRHVFGPGSFAAEEVFDTLISCEECRPDSGGAVPGTSLTTPAPRVPTTPPSTHLAGEKVIAIPTPAPAHKMAWTGPPPSIHELVAEVTEMKADLKIVEAKVVQLSNAVLTTPSPTVAPAPPPVVVTAQAARDAHPPQAARRARHAGSAKALPARRKVVLQRAHRSRHVAPKSLRHKQRVEKEEEEGSSDAEDDSEEDTRESTDHNDDQSRDNDAESDDEHTDLERDDDELGGESASRPAREPIHLAESGSDGDYDDTSDSDDAF